MATANPQAWFEPQLRDNFSLNSNNNLGRYDNAFHPAADGASPPALSPPSSAMSATTPVQPYYPAFSLEPFGPMAPSPPPNPYGIANAPPPSAGGYATALPPPFGAAQMSSSIPQRPQPWRGASGSIPTPDDNVIPTAIVIKNIPFAVSRESLLGIIESLGAPLPYAFNYHHDNGVFRGLAFANFRAPDEASSVVAALNGYDVQGRKLRVEYKKVLQPGEKDRIEREKAIKRMKSMQSMDNVKLGNDMPRQNGHGHHPQFSYDSVDSPPQSATSTSSDGPLVGLDLNDPETLRIYNMVYMFKEDRMRDQLVLSRNLNAKERRIVHLIAGKLSLTSVTKGEADKYVVVTKDTPKNPAKTTTTTSYLAPYPSDSQPPALRVKKSMPDLRGFNGPVVARDPARSLTPQRSSGSLRAEAAGGLVAGRDYASMGATHGRRLNGVGSGTFNTFFGTVIGAPPVPPLPSDVRDRRMVGDEGPGSSESGSSHGSQPLRNPRGPIGDNRGFASMRAGSSSLRGVPGSVVGRRVSEVGEYDGARSEELDL